MNLKEKMEIDEAIKFLEKQIKNPEEGLPEKIFLFISRITPLINVDLLIKDEGGRTLLSWRDDIHGRGWHIPGGIVRFKEKFETRIRKVTEKEIGAEIEFEKVPLAVNEIICKHDTRGHFISFLYRCFLSEKFIPENKGLNEKDAGYLRWHSSCPENLIKVHEVYKKFIGAER